MESEIFEHALKCEERFDELRQCEVSIVRSLSDSTAEPRVFTSINDPCTCVTAVAYECQCACKIILRGGFHMEEFEKRHFRRD